MKNDQYSNDFAGWAAAQAHIIQSLPSVRGLDRDRLAQEIADLGKRDALHFQCLVRQILSNLIKLISYPDTQAAACWNVEILSLVREASEAYKPSYNHRIDMNDAWNKAQHHAAEQLSYACGKTMAHVPQHCPISLEWMMSEAFNIEQACSALTN